MGQPSATPGTINRPGQLMGGGAATLVGVDDRGTRVERVRTDQRRVHGGAEVRSDGWMGGREKEGGQASKKRRLHRRGRRAKAKKVRRRPRRETESDESSQGSSESSSEGSDLSSGGSWDEVEWGHTGGALPNPGAAPLRQPPSKLDHTFGTKYDGVVVLPSPDDDGSQIKDGGDWVRKYRRFYRDHYGPEWQAYAQQHLLRHLEGEARSRVTALLRSKPHATLEQQFRAITKSEWANFKSCYRSAFDQVRQRPDGETFQEYWRRLQYWKGRLKLPSKDIYKKVRDHTAPPYKKQVAELVRKVRLMQGKSLSTRRLVQYLQGLDATEAAEPATTKPRRFARVATATHGDVEGDTSPGTSGALPDSGWRATAQVHTTSSLAGMRDGDDTW